MSPKWEIYYIIKAILQRGLAVNRAVFKIQIILIDRVWSGLINGRVWSATGSKLIMLQIFHESHTPVTNRMLSLVEIGYCSCPSIRWAQPKAMAAQGTFITQSTLWITCRGVKVQLVVNYFTSNLKYIFPWISSLFSSSYKLYCLLCWK